MNRSDRSQYLCEQFSALNWNLTDRQVDRFLGYYDMLVSRNRVMNLTAITDYEDVVNKHFIDSSYIILYEGISSFSSVLDLGTGAGFPGIPLAILFPDVPFTLADSLNKRILFLNDVVAALELKNVHTVHGRAEDLGRRKGMRESFELVLSRAVANLSTLCEYCLPMTCIDGLFVAYKSGQIREELTQASVAVHELGGQLEREPFFFSLPGTDQKRSLVPIRKVRSTPAQYPRKAGTPGKKPIL